MTEKQLNEKIELSVRRYFDVFLKDILPCILKKHAAACPHGRLMGHLKYGLAGLGIGLGIYLPDIFNGIKGFFTN